MTTVLVTGGTGSLGRVLVPLLRNAGHTVTVMSRSAPTGAGDGDAEPAPPGWAVADLTTGEGLAQAVAGQAVIVHAASNPFHKTHDTDVHGTQRLLEAAGAAGVAHVVFPSIVGVDRHPLRYYRAKWAAEQVVEAGPVPWTIARATQFHALLDDGLAKVTRAPVVPAPRRFAFQPVDAAEYAAVLVRLAGGSAAGRVPDTGGPEVLSFRTLAQQWLTARGKRRMLMTMPVPGRVGRAFRQGVNTCPDQAVGALTWRQYLERSAREPSSD